MQMGQVKDNEAYEEELLDYDDEYTLVKFCQLSLLLKYGFIAGDENPRSLDVNKDGSVLLTKLKKLMTHVNFSETSWNVKETTSRIMQNLHTNGDKEEFVQGFEKNLVNITNDRSTTLGPKDVSWIILLATNARAAISAIRTKIQGKEQTNSLTFSEVIEMKHYIEYIDNDVWKVIQNGNSKKRISTRKDGVIRVLPPVSAAEIHAVEKERKARTILLMAIPKEHLRRFHGMDDAKEI
ncbi:hypothetical protein Tco_0606145 [Tanacetum coccineum]